MADLTLILAAGLSLVIGVVLGMLGGGGAILTVPMLVYVIGVEPKAAIAISLFVVGTTSLVGTTVHARARNVRWRLGGAFGAMAMIGAFTGARLARFVPGAVLLVAFALVMVVTGTAMLRRRDGAGAEAAAGLGRALGVGVGVGVVSGLVGAGGGFLIVPALTLLAGLSMPEAVGTSLFVIALQSLTGFAVHATQSELDFTLVSVISAASVLGSVAGASVSARISPVRLRRMFAFLVIAMGLFMFAKQLPPLFALLVVTASLAGAALVARSAAPAPRPPVKGAE